MFQVLLGLFSLLPLSEAQGNSPEMFADDLYTKGVPAVVAKQTKQFPGKGNSKRNEVLEALFDEFPGAIFYDNKYLVFEGDIMIAEVDSNGDVKHNLKDMSLLSVGLKIMQSSRGFWEQNPVPYIISATDSRTIANVNDTIAHYEENTDWRFQVRSNEVNYIDFTDASGCWSYVGRISGSQQVGLSPYCRLSSVIHELGHAIGFWHEQSRADRDTYITVNYTNLLSPRYYNNFDIAPYQETYAPYDYQSVMHYSRHAFSTNGEDTITTVDPTMQDVIGYADGLSSSDIISAAGRRRHIAGCTGNGADYRAFVATTINGRTCQAWNVTTPHQHNHTSANYPTSDLIDNLCRNPGDTQSAPWCYTTDSAVEWELCDVQCGYPDLRITMGQNTQLLPTNVSHLSGDYVHKGLRNGNDYYVRSESSDKYLVFSGSNWLISDTLTGGSYIITTSTTESNPTSLSLRPDLWQSEVFIHIYSPQDCVVADHSYLGDGQCNNYENYNTLECGWDGGDCCSQTCQIDRGHSCNVVVHDCLDPYYANFAYPFSGTSIRYYNGQLYWYLEGNLNIQSGEVISTSFVDFLRTSDKSKSLYRRVYLVGSWLHSGILLSVAPEDASGFSFTYEGPDVGNFLTEAVLLWTTSEHGWNLPRIYSWDWNLQFTASSDFRISSTSGIETGDDAVGFSAGTSSDGAVGFGAGTTSDGAVGFGAGTSSDGAVGFDAGTTSDGAVGFGAGTTSDGAVGFGAGTTSAAGFGAGTSSDSAVGFDAGIASGGAVGFGAGASSGGAVGFGTGTTSDDGHDTAGLGTETTFAGIENAAVAFGASTKFDGTYGDSHEGVWDIDTGTDTGFNRAGVMDNSEYTPFGTYSETFGGEKRDNEPDQILTLGFAFGAAVTTLSFSAVAAFVILKKRRKYTRVVTRNVYEV